MLKRLFLFYSILLGCQAFAYPVVAMAYPAESIPSPVQGSISSPFGWRMDPMTKRSRYHSGLDIAAPSGTPIYAVQPGWVVFSGTYAGYGNLMVVEHAQGLHTWYAHTSVLLKQPGEWVNAGDNIALVGSTGRSTGPHLHFEVRIQGEATDPLQYLAAIGNNNPPVAIHPPAAHTAMALDVDPQAPSPAMPTVTPNWVGPTTKAVGAPTEINWPEPLSLLNQP
jgi:hypothetical protein